MRRRFSFASSSGTSQQPRGSVRSPPLLRAQSPFSGQTSRSFYSNNGSFYSARSWGSGGGLEHPYNDAGDDRQESDSSSDGDDNTTGTEKKEERGTAFLPGASTRPYFPDPSVSITVRHEEDSGLRTDSVNSLLYQLTAGRPSSLPNMLRDPELGDRTTSRTASLDASQGATSPSAEMVSVEAMNAKRRESDDIEAKIIESVITWVTAREEKNRVQLSRCETHCRDILSLHWTSARICCYSKPGTPTRHSVMSEFIGYSEGSPVVEQEKRRATRSETAVAYRPLGEATKTESEWRHSSCDDGTNAISESASRPRESVTVVLRAQPPHNVDTTAPFEDIETKRNWQRRASFSSSVSPAHRSATRLNSTRNSTRDGSLITSVPHFSSVMAPCQCCSEVSSQRARRSSSPRGILSVGTGPQLHAPRSRSAQRKQFSSSDELCDILPSFVIPEIGEVVFLPVTRCEHGNLVILDPAPGMSAGGEDDFAFPHQHTHLFSSPSPIKDFTVVSALSADSSEMSLFARESMRL